MKITCPKCGTPNALTTGIKASEAKPGDWCDTCFNQINSAPDPATMTEREKNNEIMDLMGPLTVPPGVIHKRIEVVMGRPVMTHEFPEIYHEAVRLNG